MSFQTETRLRGSFFPFKCIDQTCLSCDLSSNVCQLGELGKGAGKGGGGGGSIREAGGAMGKKQAAEEEMYFKYV